MTALRFVAAIGALFVANCWLVINPAWDEAEATLPETRRLEDDLIRLQAIASRLDGVQDERGRIADTTDRLRLAVPDDAGLGALRATLHDLADGAKLQLRSTPGATRETPFYREHPLLLTTSGSLHQIALFLKGIERIERVVSPIAIGLTNQRRHNGRMIVDAEIVLVAFSFVVTQPAPENAARPQPVTFRSADAGLESHRLPDPFDDGTGFTSTLPPVAGDECVRPPVRRVLYDARRARPTGPALRQVPLEELQVVGVKISGALSCALVRDVDGACHTVRLGEIVGDGSGRVSAIDEDSITVTETAVDRSTGRAFPFVVKMPVAPNGVLPPGFCPRR